MATVSLTPQEYFDKFTTPEPITGCYIWTGPVNETGYGTCKHGSAHRYFYRVFLGPIPHGYDVDHLCRNRQCVNPAHLEAVTHAENVRRGQAKQLYHRPDHCKHGHLLDDNNTFPVVRVRYGKTYNERGCRICRTIRKRSWRAADYDNYRIKTNTYRREMTQRKLFTVLYWFSWAEQFQAERVCK